jgi:hypothetical protein
MDVEELKAKLQAECSRREIFERKNAELEALNDRLRTENDVSFIERPSCVAMGTSCVHRLECQCGISLL